MTNITRRSTLSLLGASAFVPGFLTAHAAGAEDRKLIFIILRGAMDGLAALIPDDAELEQLRTHTVPARSERLDLGNGFRLHPALSGLHNLYREGDVGFVPAAATPYRDRSHFDGQDFLETLGRTPDRDGWLNRAVQVAGGTALAVGYDVPLALRGSGLATNWSPPVFESASDDLLDRLQDLYAGWPELSEPLAMSRSFTMEGAEMSARGRGRGAEYAVASKALGELMSKPDGPNIGMLSFNGWDTHANQAGVLSARFGGLDAAISGLKTALGANWSSTSIAICSEFGRTAAENGSRGTDHGTGGLVILAGGAIKGGQVHGDWPGLRPQDMFENRDVAPANDVVSVLKGVLRDHLSLSQASLDQTVFHDHSRAMDGLVGA
ncbi:MAG: DUF1501 domain-containing protein [Pseudomonadota bacterium]